MIPRLLRAALAAALFCAVAACAHAEDSADQRLGFDVMPRYQSIRLTPRRAAIMATMITITTTSRR